MDADGNFHLLLSNRYSNTLEKAKTSLSDVVRVTYILPNAKEFANDT